MLKLLKDIPVLVNKKKSVESYSLRINNMVTVNHAPM
jgi:hypothetical protein